MLLALIPPWNFAHLRRKNSNYFGTKVLIFEAMIMYSTSIEISKISVNILSSQERSSTFKVCFLDSKYPYLHSTYLVRILFFRVYLYLPTYESIN